LTYTSESSASKTKALIDDLASKYGTVGIMVQGNMADTSIGDLIVDHIKKDEKLSSGKGLVIDIIINNAGYA
jgi:hypothetical protein